MMRVYFQQRHCRGHLSDISIWRLVKQIRRFADTPIVVAARTDNEVGIVKALEMGADERRASGG